MSENEVGGIDSTRLNSLIERIERLEEEKKALPQTSAIFMQRLKASALMSRL